MAKVGRPSKAMLNLKKSLALARKAQLKARTARALNADATEDEGADNESSEGEVECTGWSGGLAHYISSDEEPIFISDSDEEEDEVEELSGNELEELIQQNLKRLTGTNMVGQPAGTAKEPLSAMASTQLKAEPNAFSVVMKKRTDQEWKGVESTRSLGYNGRSDRTKRHLDKKARDKETEDAKMRKG